MSHLERPGPGEYAEYYARYVARVPDGDIVMTLATEMEATIAMVDGLSDDQALHAYAPGKWSIKEVLGHIADAERVFAYRALRFGRGDQAPLEGFDENRYVPAGRFDQRTVASLTAELRTVRHATVSLLAGLPDEAWTRAGTASGYPVTVRGVAWITAGHELHHREILARRDLAIDAVTGSVD
jgi:uncharacterized damage-inducible protein DinB